MPGTIQVTVLEFKGFSSSSKASAKSLKVSMGKRQFQTWDKGDFSIPITKLGEDLVVSLLDAGGNEIAHQDIRTMQIIEKGNWDEVFAIDGGGHAHMKLRFVLSEEERHRVRIMRESAVKKKLETNPNIKLRLLQLPNSVETSTKNGNISDSQKGFSDIDEGRPRVEGSQAGSSLPSATSSADPSTLPGCVPEIAIPDATDGNLGKHELISGSHKLLDIVPYEPFAIVRLEAKEGPQSSKFSDNKNVVAPKLLDYHPSVEKTPSSVRKMISAFESSKTQEVKSLRKVSSVPDQLNRLRKATVLSEDQESKPDKRLTDSEEAVCIIPSDDGSSEAPKELSSTETPSPSGESDLQELKKMSPVNLMRQSTSETASSSGRMPEDQIQPYQLSSNSINSTESSETTTSPGRKPEEQTQPYELSSNSTESSVVQGSGSGRGRGTSLKSSTMIMASDKKLTLEDYNEEFNSGQTSGMWIFPDSTSRMCVTTAGHHQNEAKTHHIENISSKSNVLNKSVIIGREFKTERMQNVAEAGSDSSPNGSFNGIIGQVIKIGVIIGFGVLVLLTRQKEPRKKHREENGNLFHVPEYV